jgi:hypothetical protein
MISVVYGAVCSMADTDSDSASKSLKAVDFQRLFPSRGFIAELAG